MEKVNGCEKSLLVDQHTWESHTLRRTIKEETFDDTIIETVENEATDCSRLSEHVALENRSIAGCKSGAVHTKPAERMEWQKSNETLNLAVMTRHGFQAHPQTSIKEEPDDSECTRPETDLAHFHVKVEPLEYVGGDDRLNVTETLGQAYQRTEKKDPNSEGGPSWSEKTSPQFPLVTVKCETPEHESSSQERLIKRNVFVSSNSLSVTKSQHKNPSKQFSCYYCGRKSTTKASLKRHMSQHTKKKRFECDICNVSFNYVSHLKTHHMIHSGKRPYTCCLCNHASASSYNLKVHMRSHTGEKPFACDACDYRTKQKVHLVSHLKKHVDGKPQLIAGVYACKMCDYRSPSRMGLQNHKKLHEEKKPNICGICEYSNLDKKLMKMHRKLHTIGNTYKCHLCNYCSSSASHVKTHMMTHTDEKPHKCDFCNYRCKQRAHLKTHIMAHKGEKPFKCKYCEYRSNQSIHIKTHIQNYCQANKIK